MQFQVDPYNVMCHEHPDGHAVKLTTTQFQLHVQPSVDSDSVVLVGVLRILPRKLFQIFERLLFNDVLVAADELN